jgi:hypothetical protein
MLTTLQSNVSLPPMNTYSLDASDFETKATGVTYRTVKDAEYGSQGEVSTEVPALRSITLYSDAGEITAIENARVAEDVEYETSSHQINVLTMTTIKGVK